MSASSVVWKVDIVAFFQEYSSGGTKTRDLSSRCHIKQSDAIHRESTVVTRKYAIHLLLILFFIYNIYSFSESIFNTEENVAY